MFITTDATYVSQDLVWCNRWSIRLHCVRS